MTKFAWNVLHTTHFWTRDWKSDMIRISSLFRDEITSFPTQSRNWINKTFPLSQQSNAYMWIENSGRIWRKRRMQERRTEEERSWKISNSSSLSSIDREIHSKSQTSIGYLGLLPIFEGNRKSERIEVNAYIFT